MARCSTLLGVARAALAVLLALPALAPAVPDYPFLEELWRPDDRVPVATFDGDVIDQEEIFLWQVIHGRDALVARLATQQGTDSRALQPLADAVRDLVQARLLADEARAAGIVQPWYEEKGSRVLAAPVGIMVLADLVVRPEVRVEEEDVVHYFQENRERFLLPAQGDIIRLRVPLADLAEPAEREAAMKRAAELRTQAVVDPGGLAAVLQSNPHLAIDQPAGSPVRVTRGDGRLRRDVEEQVFQMRLTQVSAPVALPGGVWLYELRTRTQARPRPLAEVRDEITERLQRRFFRQQLDHRVAESIEDILPVNRIRSYALLEDSMELIQVGDFILSKGEFDTLFPDVEKLMRGRPTRELIDKSHYVVETEAVTQVLAREGFVGHPRYETALELGATLAAARKAREIPREIADPTPEQLAEYVEAHRDELAPAWSSVVWRLAAAPRTPGELGPRERAALASDMQRVLGDTIAEAARLMDDRVRLNGPTAFVSPQFIVDRVVDPNHPDFTMTFERVGEMTAAQARDRFSLDLESLPVGSFSPALPRGDGTVVSYYRADRVDQQQPTSDILLQRAAAAWKRDLAENPARDQLREIEASGRLTFHFPQ